MKSKEKFRPDFEILFNEGCKESLSIFEKDHINSPNLFELELVKMAKEYRERCC